MNLLLKTVIHATELWSIAKRPVDWERRNAERLLQVIEQLQRLARGAVALIHEGEDRHTATSAHFKQFARLRLDTLTCINHHDRGIDGREHAIGVLTEVIVARRIKKVDAKVVVVKLQHRAGDGDAALAFQFHPVTGGGALVLARGDRAG